MSLGFTLAGVEAGNQCCTFPQISSTLHQMAHVLLRLVCGDAIENGASIISNCSQLDVEAMTPCSSGRGLCGSTDIIAIYTLPGTGLIPMIPFDSDLDGFFL